MENPQIISVEDSWSWTSWYGIAIITNAILGFVWIEWGMHKSARFRTVSPELDAKFPAWRRLDAQSWSRFKMYPGAMTLLIPRLLLGVSIIIFIAIFCRIVLVCHDMKRPITGCRKFIIVWFFKFIIRFLALACFFCWLSHKEFEAEDPRVDYSEYLGSNWRKELKDYLARGGNDTMIISNHNGLFDNMCHLTSKFFPSFTAST